ncbi:hypothetical protein RND71_039780 [Anisodus tanguticus]|uniref:Uncharacterized protein n=1 Tax=Anisodus tanguticus TaxID=243964 RepID=A0AAE1QWF2_9SOLA|nr:hypothetical protein RND71_039780 [Anisodus tanguticus]
MQTQDVPSAAPQVSQSSQEFVFMPTPRVNAFPKFEYLSVEHDPDPALRPSIISEAETRFHRRQNVQLPSGTRRISFIGDDIGVSEPTDLPYSPTKLTWKGKVAVTDNQLEKQSRQQRIQKLR